MNPTTIFASCFVTALLFVSCKASQFGDSSKKENPAAKQPSAPEKMQTDQALSNPSATQNSGDGEAATGPVNVTGVYLTCAPSVADASATATGYGCSLVNSASQPVNLGQSYKQYQWNSAASGTPPASVNVTTGASALTNQQVGVIIGGGTQVDRDSTTPMVVVSFIGTTADSQNVALQYHLTEAINKKASPLSQDQMLKSLPQTIPVNTANAVAGVPVSVAATGSQSFPLCPEDGLLANLGAVRYIPGGRQTSSDGKYYFDYIKDEKSGTFVRDFCTTSGDAKWQYQNSDAGDGCTCLTPTGN